MTNCPRNPSPAAQEWLGRHFHPAQHLMAVRSHWNSAFYFLKNHPLSSLGLLGYWRILTLIVSGAGPICDRACGYISPPPRERIAFWGVHRVRGVCCLPSDQARGGSRMRWGRLRDHPSRVVRRTNVCPLFSSAAYPSDLDD